MICEVMMEKQNPNSEASVLNFFGRCRPRRSTYSGLSMVVERGYNGEDEQRIVCR